jgi:hypothetical protein
MPPLQPLPPGQPFAGHGVVQFFGRLDLMKPPILGKGIQQEPYRGKYRGPLAENGNNRQH